MNEQELAQSLKKAIAIIDQADVPADLREEAFRAIWSSLAEEPSTVTILPSSEHGASITAKSTIDVWSVLAQKLAIDPEILKDVYDLLEEGSFAVRVPTSALPKAKSAATRDIALLVCAGRQSGMEEWTRAEIIRATCQEYGKFDSANHAANMAEGDKYWQISGSGKDRRYKLRKSGWEQAGQLVRRLAGD